VSGIAAALWAQLWITQFSADPQVVEMGTTYLRMVGPAYGFFGLGLALYFASQGAGRLFWPLSAGFLRMLIAIGGGFIALRLTGSLQWLFVALALRLFLHCAVLCVARASGECLREAPRARNKSFAMSTRLRSPADGGSQIARIGRNQQPTLHLQR